jgi:hypothetical protein
MIILWSSVDYIACTVGREEQKSENYTSVFEDLFLNKNSSSNDSSPPVFSDVYRNLTSDNCQSSRCFDSGQDVLDQYYIHKVLNPLSNSYNLIQHFYVLFLGRFGSRYNCSFCSDVCFKNIWLCYIEIKK